MIRSLHRTSQHLRVLSYVKYVKLVEMDSEALHGFY